MTDALAFRACSSGFGKVRAKYRFFALTALKTHNFRCDEAKNSRIVAENREKLARFDTVFGGEA